MIAIDTNVLVRYLAQDDPAQSAIASRELKAACSEDSPGFISQIVLCELVWVLQRAYGYERAQIAKTLAGVLSTRTLHVEQEALSWKALRAYERGRADFSDYLIGHTGMAHRADCTITFDEKAAEHPAFRLLS